MWTGPPLVRISSARFFRSKEMTDKVGQGAELGGENLTSGAHMQTQVQHCGCAAESRGTQHFHLFSTE